MLNFALVSTPFQRVKTVEMCHELRRPIYGSVAAQAIDYDKLQQLMSAVKWDVKEIMSQHNVYVDVILQVSWYCSPQLWYHIRGYCLYRLTHACCSNLQIFCCGHEQIRFFTKDRFVLAMQRVVGGIFPHQITVDVVKNTTVRMYQNFKGKYMYIHVIDLMVLNGFYCVSSKVWCLLKGKPLFDFDWFAHLVGLFRLFGKIWLLSYQKNLCVDSKNTILKW